MKEFGELVHLITDAAKEVEAIDSFRLRLDERPPSAAWHLRLDKKEYILVLQPTDLPPIKKGS